MLRRSLLIGLFIFGAEFLILKGDEIEEVPAVSGLPEPEDGNGTVMSSVPGLPEPEDGNGTVMSSSPFLKEMNDSFLQELESYAGEKSGQDILKDIRDIVDMIENVDGDSDLPRNCDEALKGRGVSGVHKIYLPESGMPPFFVHCIKVGDKTNWMTLLRRMDGSINFYRDWSYYKNGFGNLNGEYWLGLDLMHAVTSSEPHEIWFEMEDHKGERRYALYDQFLIGDEKSNYTLQALGKYVGSAGDSLRFQAGNQFSTKDMDNDSKNDGSCAQVCKGAWWFGNCRESHFNGLYNNNEDVYPWGIHWYGWRGRDYSLRYVHMAIRPLGKGNIQRSTVESTSFKAIPRDYSF